MSRWATRLERLKDKQRGLFEVSKTTFQVKTPQSWPFCLGCHLAAPEAIYPMDARDPSKGLGPDLSTWGTLEVPNANLFREKHHICPNCTTGVAQKLVNINKSVTAKLQGIAEQEARKAGLIPKLEASIAMVQKVHKSRITHPSDCNIWNEDQDHPRCTCGADKLVKE